VGDGVADDTTAIQAAMDETETWGGGIIFFPPGKYKISNTLKLPSKVYLKGVTGTSFTKIFQDPSVYLNEMNTILWLADNQSTPISMIEPKTPNNFGAAGIENLVLYGNRDTATSSGYFGIKLPDSTTEQRSHAEFKHVFIFDVKGTGFYGGVGHHELLFDFVIVYGSESHGFELRGEDLQGNRVWSGANGGIGIKFPGSASTTIGSGSGRFSHVDTWGNDIGMEISDSLSYFFFGLNVNVNKKHGLHLFPTTPTPPPPAAPGFSPGRITIFRGNFSGNSQDANGGFSAVYLEGNQVPPPDGGYGPYNITFLGTEFLGTPPGSGNGNKPKYAIEDASAVPRRCLVAGGMFRRSGYQGPPPNGGTYSVVSNKPQAIRDCFDYDTAKQITETEIPYNWTTGTAPYVAALGDSFIYVDASGGARTVNLPKLAELPVGRVFYISKADNSSNGVTIAAQAGELINGAASVSITGLRQTYLIVHGGTGWVGIQIA